MKINEHIKGLRIKHADWPYILYPLLLILIVSGVTYREWGEVAGFLTFQILSLFWLLFYMTHLYRSVKRDLHDQQQKNQATHTLWNLHSFDVPLPYMSGWSATPELALAITDTIRQNNSKFVLELGSGISTIISGKTLSRSGKGRVLALDHDEAYLKKTQIELEKHGVSHISSLCYTPLIPVTLKRGTWQWYDLSRLPEPIPPIDLLIVDGPPVKTQKYSRYPALPQLFDRLAPGAVVIVHDTHRNMESEAITFWMEEYPDMSAEFIDSEKGITIINTNKKTH
ncbi:MAG: class I SAM-dependent methyltransferase [Balneolaceae bacterium]